MLSSAVENPLEGAGALSTVTRVPQALVGYRAMRRLNPPRDKCQNGVPSIQGSCTPLKGRL